jgi:hypothetical protein
MDMENKKDKSAAEKKTNKTWAAILAHQGEIQVLQKGLFL